MPTLDLGFEQTEQLSIRLEYRIMKNYEQAAKEMEEKTTRYFEKFTQQDEAKRKAWEAGRITKKEYTEWRERKMITGERWKAMRDTLATDLANYDKIAMSYVRDCAKDVYCVNMNYGTYALEKASGINTSFTLYNKDAIKVLMKDNPQLLPKYANPKVDIPLDKRWNMQHIQNAVAQGILQGESIPQVAKRLQDVTGMDERAAIRNARTAMTSAQNAGRLDAAKRMEAMGIACKKGWLATLDNVTRDSHVDVDGEVVELDKNFSNGLQYPADGAGAPEEVYNCRCRLTTEYDKYKTNWADLSKRNTNKFGDMSYDEWKKAAHERVQAKKQKIVSKAEAQKIQAEKAAYIKYIDENVKKHYNIDYNEVSELEQPLSDDEIIEKISGGDLTEGSCASLSYAYIANKYCGLDVTDYRGGDSRKLFSRNSLVIEKLLTDDCKINFVSKEARDVAKAIQNIEIGKEYRLVTGRHAAMIRKTEKGLEYLELQSNVENGWKSFETKRQYEWVTTVTGKRYLTYEEVPCKIADTLYTRFGCRKTTSGSYWLIDAEKYRNNDNFKDMMGYINTAADKQKKGVKGFAK